MGAGDRSSISCDSQLGFLIQVPSLFLLEREVRPKPLEVVRTIKYAPEVVLPGRPAQTRFPFSLFCDRALSLGRDAVTCSPISHFFD